jgi:peptide/nickel transport system substrate-binding protein
MVFSTTRRSLLIGAGAMSATGLLGMKSLRAANNDPQSGGTFRIGISEVSSADRLDPQLNETRFMINLQYQLRNSLVEMGPGGVLIPELATEWGANSDLTEWTFKLRSGVEFHNGRTMTAEDVVWSLNLHRGPDTISHAQAPMQQVTDVTATDPLEVKFTLEAPNAGFPAILSLIQLLIVPAEDMDFDAGIGTGGYILETLEPGVRSIVRRNPNYWKEGRGHFDAIEMFAISDVNARTTALQTGQIDAMQFVDATTAKLLAATPDINLIQTQSKLHYAFSMNTTDPRFTDPKVRMAMKLAINREDILERIFSGFGSLANDQPLSEAYLFHNPTLEQHSYDPDQARYLLEQAGAAGLTLPLHVSNAPFPGTVDMAQLYAQHAAAAGINIEIRREPEDGYWSNIWGQRPCFATRWSGRVNEDVKLTLSYSRESIGSWNETSWDNEAFNRALREARGEADEDRRRELYWECQRLIWEDGGMVAPVFADFLDATNDRVGHGEVANDWDLDGGRAGERWWFKA